VYQKESMTVIDLQSIILGAEYATHLMIKAAEGAKNRGIKYITLDDCSDRYRVDHNIYVKLGLEYENLTGGPEMKGLVSNVLKHVTKTKSPKIWTKYI